MKSENQKNKSFDEVKKEIYFCYGSFTLSSVLFFTMYFKFTNLLFIIILAHIGMFITLGLLNILTLILVRKYVSMYILPITFCMFLFNYNYYDTVIHAMLKQLSSSSRLPLTDMLFVNPFFVSFTYFILILSIWHHSFHLFRKFKNSITIFSPSKNK